MTAPALDLSRLDALARARPETAAAPTIWRDVLAPELESREAARAALLNDTYKRTAIGVGIGVVIMIILALLIGMPGDFFIFGAIAVCLVSVGAVTGTRWIKVFSMKSQTKDLILSAACEPFGFTYDTLHPDLQGINTLSDALNAGREFADQKRAEAAAANTGVKVSFSTQSITGHTPPTPAYETLKKAKLLSSHDSRKFEDLIEGTRAGAAFSLHEAKLTDSSGDDTTTTFQGLLFHVEYPQRFLGRTVIARSGFWKRNKWSGDLERVHLISKELEDAFTVYSNDQVEARALLTPDRMERLIALERHFRGGKLRAIFEDGHMTVALEAPDQFEAGSIFKPLVDPQRYISALEELGLVCDLIDGFLTRDWVKGRI